MADRFDGYTIAKMLRTMVAHKGHRTRLLRKAQLLLNFIGAAPPSPVAMEDLDTTVRKLATQMNIITAGYMWLEVHDLANIEENETEVNVLVDEITTLDMRVLQVRHRIPVVPAAPVGAPIAAPAGGARGPRPVDALKPAILSRDNTPAEFRSWAAKFAAYHAASNFQACTLPEQHAFLMVLLDLEMETRLQSLIDARTPIFTVVPAGGGAAPINCIGLLKEEFLQSYPVNARRYDFLSYKQKAGQPFTQFATLLRQKGDEADLAAMGVDDLYCLVYVLGCQDDKLKKKMLEIEHPTLVLFDALARTHERVEASSKGLAGATAKAAASAAAGKPARRGRGEIKDQQGQAQGQTTLQQRRQQLMASGMCFGCGDKSHRTADCQTKTNLKCRNCGKMGHNALVCLQSGTPAPRAARAQPQDGGGAQQQQQPLPPQHLLPAMLQQPQQLEPLQPYPADGDVARIHMMQQQQGPNQPTPPVMM